MKERYVPSNIVAHKYSFTNMGTLGLAGFAQGAWHLKLYGIIRSMFSTGRRLPGASQKASFISSST